MVNFYPKNDWLTLTDVSEVTNPNSVFVAKALPGGHPIMILEGHAGDTRQIHRDLVYLMIQNTNLN